MCLEITHECYNSFNDYEANFTFLQIEKMRNYYDKENFISQKTCFCE